MNPRELIILLLGFVMVAVLLRGLFVAIQVRKGQIRLTIDKNIPQDFDPEELELAELPTGGARVVSRADASQDFQSDDSFDRQNDAASHNDGLIPILMDVVELGDSGIDPDELGAEDQDSGHTQFNADTAGLAAPNILNQGSESDWDHSHIVAEELQSNSVAPHGFEEATEHEPDGVTSDGLGPEAAQYKNAYDLHEGLNSVGSIEKTSYEPEISDYPENEWYEDDELYAVSDRNHEEARPDSMGIDYTTQPVEGFEKSNSASFVSDKSNEFSAAGTEDSLPGENSLDILESDDLSDSGRFENFSMTAGERIGFDEPQVPSDPEEDASGDRQASSNKNPILRGGLNRLLSVFKSKPNEGLLEKTPIWEDKESTLPSDLIEELEDFIDQNESDLSYKDDEGDKSDFDPTEQQLRDDYELASNLDNVTSIEQATGAISTGRSDTDMQESRSKISNKPTNPEPLEVLVMSVMSPLGSVFEGRYLVQTIEKAGFRYGEMGIFHLYDGIEEDTNLICSAANALNPGTFDLDQLSEFTTIGVSFFLALPTSLNNLQALEKMLNAAQQISNDLGGELKDDQRNVLTSQTIEHYRQRIRDFELNQLKVAGGRG
ncbi:MAG: cell division protein ZipA [Pseudohongiellaceae bacterium]